MPEDWKNNTENLYTRKVIKNRVKIIDKLAYLAGIIKYPVKF